MSKKGFTLIELMVVIAIIGVLSSVLAPQIFKQINKGRVAAAISFYNSLKTAAFSYYSDTEVWPADGTTGRDSLTAMTSTITGWSGPYIDRWPQAGPWVGTSYTWENDSSSFGGTSARYVTISCSGTCNMVNADLQEIDKKIDGAADGAAGAMRYSGTTAQLLIAAN